MTRKLVLRLRHRHLCWLAKCTLSLHVLRMNVVFSVYQSFCGQKLRAALGLL